MQEVFNFILSHWETLLSVAMFILSGVVFIIRKKPVNGLSDLITAFVSTAVKLAEVQPDIKGKDKLEFALNYVNEHLTRLYPNLDIHSYRSYIVYAIEDMLSTPHKKEDK